MIRFIAQMAGISNTAIITIVVVGLIEGSFETSSLSSVLLAITPNILGLILAVLVGTSPFFTQSPTKQSDRKAMESE